ncbi:ABC transporter permease [Candidatus Epulonipiscium fishelsonii]|uniref:ABC transporter permease n=1 Tax=Candidatus Epulonipiscium fishelsonii TaxID=77094 RepID=A0ACC8X8I9_9FIRM|nr:ABC transporter permease [Epulopiscium sp. SCG-D08WGA-EpuloA1]
MLRIKVIILLLLSILTILLGIGIGSTIISPIEVGNIILNKLFGVQLIASVSDIDISIVWNLRLIRTLMAFVIGGALAISGSAMQSVLQNPLASSYTLGVSAGASLGAGIIIITSASFFDIFTIPVVGICFGIVTVFAVITLANKFDRNMQNYTIVLVGMVLSLFINAIITVLNAMFRENMQQLIFWQMGSFAGKSPEELLVVTILSVIGSLILILKSRELDMMSFGETQAFSMGVDVKKAKWILLMGAAALTGSAISFVGIIGFVDLIAPHVVRKIFGPKHNIVIPMSALFGGVFMVCADILARIILSPIDLPVGAVTALFGAPFFMYIFFRKERL